LSRLFLLHVRHEDPSRCGEDPDDRHPLDKVLYRRQRRALRQTMRAVREHVLREDANVLADRAKSGYAPSDCSPSARRMPP
jgi:hypothetical protein